jgi:hypothetical protein
MYAAGDDSTMNVSWIPANLRRGILIWNMKTRVDRVKNTAVSSRLRVLVNGLNSSLYRNLLTTEPGKPSVLNCLWTRLLESPLAILQKSNKAVSFSEPAADLLWLPVPSN